MGNKKNTLLIIVSIVISTALFNMNIISEDATNLMINQAKNEFTLKHAQYINPKDEEIKYRNNTSIDKVGKSMLLELVILVKVKHYKFYLRIKLLKN